MFGSSSLKPILWNFGELSLTRGTAIATTYLLTWYVDPNAFALLAIVNVYVQLARMTVDLGFKDVMIQEKAISEHQINTMFTVSILFSTFLYILIFIFSDFIAAFYQITELSEVMKYTLIILIFNSINVPSVIILFRSLKMREHFLVKLPSVILASLVAIILAYHGYGVWALVIQIVLQDLLSSLSLLLASGWKPRLSMRIQKLYNLSSLAMYLLINRIIGVLAKNSYFIILPFFVTPNTLGIYFLADKLKDAIFGIILTSVQNVSHVSLSRANEKNIDKEYETHIFSIAKIFTPICVTMYFLSSEFIHGLFDQSWVAVGSALSILSISAIFLPFHLQFTNLMKVKKLGKQLTRVTIYKSIVSITLLLITVEYGLIAILHGQVAATMLNLCFNFYYTAKCIDYRYLQQLKHIILPIVFCGISAFLVNMFTIYIDSSFSIFMILLFLIIYSILAALYKHDQQK